MGKVRLLLLTGQGGGGPLLDRETNGEGGATARLAVYPNFPPVFFDDTKGHGKPQSRALDTGFGGKERVKNILHHLGGNPRSGILDLNLRYPVPCRCGNGHSTPTVGDRFFGVLQNI